MLTQIYKGPASDYRCFKVCPKNRDDHSQGGKCLTNLSAYCCYDELQQLCNNWINLIGVSGLHMAEDSPQGWQGCSVTAFSPLTPRRPCRKWVSSSCREPDLHSLQMGNAELGHPQLAWSQPLSTSSADFSVLFHSYLFPSRDFLSLGSLPTLSAGRNACQI